MTRAARIVFGLLVLATLGAFVLGQKLKSSPPIVMRDRVALVFSPRTDLPEEKPRRGSISFFLTEGDDITVSIVDRSGRIVRTIVDDVHLPERVRRTWFWDGRTRDGRFAPDGYYRVRVALIHQGRTIDLPDKRMAVDTKPPRPRVTAVEPEGGTGPAFLPQRGVEGVTVSFRGTEGRRAALQVWRTDLPRPRVVEEVEIPARESEVVWDGTIDGRPAPAGTYLMGLLAYDRAGNEGAFPARPPEPGRAVPGRAGVTVRYLAVAPPAAPVRAGRVGIAFVDARRRAWSWALRRWGEPRVIARGRGDGPRLRFRVPRGQAGLHVLTVATRRGDRTRVPIAVEAPVSRRVLVVLPALTWEGRNPVDDDGDGMPNVLDAAGRDASARLNRPLAHGLPASIPAREGALLRFLDENLLRYDLTTDTALALGTGPGLDEHDGVVLAGDSRWITPGLRRALRDHVAGGGRVWSLGTDALRRTVELRDGVLSRPSAPSPTDALGARPTQPLVEPDEPADLVTYLGADEPVFDLTDGFLPGVERYEALASVIPSAELLAAAGPDAETPVLAAWRLGDGTAVHSGVPDLAARAAAGDAAAGAIVRSLWAFVAG